jgi:hypothetical protein
MYVGGCGTSSFICHGKREGRRSSSGRREISERKKTSHGEQPLVALIYY